MKRLLLRTQRRGFALLLVLIIVTFAAAIAVLFLLSARQEQSSTGSFTESSRIDQLSSMAVNMVMGQINAATRENPVNPTAATTISWASQPGMIRTYNQDGKLSNAYKLYSWGPINGQSSMIEPGDNFDPVNDTGEYPPSNWSTQTAQYTDLNQPVNSVYPIMDPSIADTVPASGTATSNNTAGITWDFPGEVGIPASSGTSNYYPSTNNTLPMPVQWIYVLQDGTWTFPSSVNGGVAQFSNTAGANPTATNPIVGRIAFWTDDETAKVNVNTASEGANWTVPTSGAMDDMQFVFNPPVRNEFQRISGHPATTSMSAVFPEMRTSSFARWAPGGAVTPSYLADMQNIFSLNPRISWGTSPLTGSQAGTFPMNIYNPTYIVSQSELSGGSGGDALDPGTYSPIPLSTNRLYATADELWFQPNRNANLFPNSPSAIPAVQALTPQQLSQRLFLLTANSSAPETTVFDTPRISLWPITYPNKSSFFWSFSGSPVNSYCNIGAFAGRTATMLPSTIPDPNSTTNPPKTLAGITASKTGDPVITPAEQLLAFCATLNEQAPNGASGSLAAPSLYYFQRQNPDSPANNPSPTSSPEPTGGATTSDWNILRNQQLTTYLRSEMDEPAPGMSSASLATKWNTNNSGNADWIALNCFDFSRSLINQYTYNPGITASPDSLLYSYTGISGRQFYFGTSNEEDYSEPNTAAVVPLRIQPTQAPFNTGNTYVTEGSYPALKEAAVMFYATSRNIPEWPSEVIPPIPPATTPTTVPWANESQPVQTTDLQNPNEWWNLITQSSSTTTGGVTTALPGNTQTTSMQAVMFLSFAQLNPGNPSFNPVFWVKVTGTPFSVSGAGMLPTSLNFPNSSKGSSFQWSTWGISATSNNFSYLFYKQYNQPKIFDNSPPSGSHPEYYPLTSNTAGYQGIVINPSKGTTFSFEGSVVTISIYAPYPSDMDIDPTQDPNQLVSSQQVDFTKCNGTLPIPLAPRWTTWQIIQQAGSKGGGVYMPNPATAGTNPPTLTPPYTGDLGWQAEIVPGIEGLSSMGATQNVGTDFRNMALPPYPAGYGENTSAYGDSGTNNPALTYVFATGGIAKPGTLPPLDSLYNPPLGTVNCPSGIINSSGSAVYSSGLEPNVFSADIRCRVEALCQRGETERYVFASETPSALSDLFDCSTGLPGGQGQTLITPYDTVVSMVPDPTLPTSGQPNVGGDPRLIGRGLVTNSPAQTGMTNFVALNSITGISALGGALPTTGMLGAGPNHVIRNTGETYTDTASAPTMPQLNTDQAQWEELGWPAATENQGGYFNYPMITGVQPMPSFGGYSGGGFQYFNASSNTGSNFMAIAASSSNTAPTALGAPTDGVFVEANATNSIPPDGDWTSMPGLGWDGGYIARPDQDYQAVSVDFSASSYVTIPYYQPYGSYSVSSTAAATNNASTGAFFMPNRQVPSPVIMGTLPSDMTTGWQTLTFCPNPANAMDNGASADIGLGTPNAPSAAGVAYNMPPDHLLLDLFWMPVAEPYPISEQFATAGKINLNYAIMPFSYIQRKTGLDAVLKPVWINALPGTKTSVPIAPYYKGFSEMASLYPTTHSRYPINVSETLQAFDYKFQQGDIFRSASQICDMFLYPNDPVNPNTPAQGSGPDTPGQTSSITAWWRNNQFTSDNGREDPYNAIYSRVTTKSNTYTVHWRVQALHKVANSSPTVWTDGQDQVTGEMRGSSLIERYIDPNATNIPDYAANAFNGETSTPLSYYYKWRIASETYFQPSP